MSIISFSMLEGELIDDDDDSVKERTVVFEIMSQDITLKF